MALFNALVRPVVLALAGRRSLILVAVLVLVLQVLVFLVAAKWARASTCDGFLTALIGSFIYAIINTILTAILGVDSGGSYYGLLVQRLMVKRSQGHIGQAGPRDHPDRRPRPPDPRRPDARRLGQHDGRAGSATAPTSCRAGRRSCRR